MKRNKTKLKLVVDNTPKKSYLEKSFLNHEQLIAKLNNSNGNHLSREQIVLQNLKDMGL